MAFSVIAVPVGVALFAYGQFITASPRFRAFGAALTTSGVVWGLLTAFFGS